MFGTWATASDTDVADALRAARTIADPDYTTHDNETFPAEELYESRQGTDETHEHHHINI